MNTNVTIHQIKLVFPDLSRLWSFSRSLTNQNLEINANTRMLTCDCTKADLYRAVTQYGTAQFDENKDQFDRCCHQKDNVIISAPSK